MKCVLDEIVLFDLLIALTIRHFSFSGMKSIADRFTLQNFCIERVGEVYRGLVDEAHIFLAANNMTDSRILQHSINAI